jgi:hypothetical protein
MAERTRTAGWLPNQHGAWAMLIVPFAAGTILSWRDGRLAIHLMPMFITWVLGYFAFHAASGWLKSPSARRRRWLPALSLYGLASLLAGLTTAWLAGPSLLWWLAVFATPLGAALWLASRRKERHLAGGLLTTLIASAMVLVVRFPNPLAMLDDPAFLSTALLAAIMFGYFGGTVLHVKAMIRERGSLAWRNASIAWHTIWTITTTVLVLTGQLSRVWPVFFLLTTIRAWALPTIAERRHPPGARAIGLVEILLTVVLLVTVVATSAPNPPT